MAKSGECIESELDAPWALLGDESDSDDSNLGSESSRHESPRRLPKPHRLMLPS